jgi:hypothetical protein
MSLSHCARTLHAVRNPFQPSLLSITSSHGLKKALKKLKGDSTVSLKSALNLAVNCTLKGLRQLSFAELPGLFPLRDLVRSGERYCTMGLIIS